MRATADLVVPYVPGVETPTVAASVPGRSLNLSDPKVRTRLTPAAIEGIVRLAGLWELTSEECCLLLGDLSERSWFRLKKGDGARTDRPLRLSQDMLTRISILVGLFKGLRLLFSEPLADSWMRLPNKGPLFDGRTPLEAAIEGGIPKLLDIRRHVDALRGGL